jgi:hypothetical protein
MSAWVVSCHHINLLVSAAIDHGISFKFHRIGSLETATEETAQALGQMLWAENVRSVVHRYDLSGTSEHDDYLRALSAYGFKRYAGIRAAAAASALTCFDYQSCECPDYEDTPAALFVRQLRDAVGDRPHGYDAEPWGYDTEAQVETAQEAA